MNKIIENVSDFEIHQENIIELGVASIETKGKSTTGETGTGKGLGFVDEPCVLD